MSEIRISDLPESPLTANLTNSIFVFVDLESDVTYKIPASDMGLGGSGGGATLPPWKVISANTLAEDGSRFLANTSNGSFYIQLPSTPTVGAAVEIADDSNFANTNLFISGNGKTIENDYEGIEVDIGSLIMQMIYNGNTWQIFASSATTEAPSFVDENTGEVRVPGSGEVGQVQYVGPRHYLKGTPTITTSGRSVVLKTYKPNRVQIGTLAVTGNVFYTEHGNVETFVVSVNTGNSISNTTYFTYNYYGSGLEVDKNNNLYVVGGNGLDKALFIRYDANGIVTLSNSISHNTYSYVTGECIAVDPNQNTFIVTTSSDDSGNLVSTLTKLDRNGRKRWAKSSFRIPEGLVVEDLVLDTNNNIHFVGSKYYSNNQGIIVKLNEFGDTIFQRNVVSGNANSKVLTTSSIYIKGDNVYYSSIENTNTNLNNDFQKILIKTDITGNTLWKKTLPKINNGQINFLPVYVDSKNNIVTLETFYNGTSSLFQSIIHLTDEEGNYKKGIKLYSPTRDIQLIASDTDANNNYYFSGITYGSNFKADVILLKMNSEFDIEWKKSLGKYTENDFQYYSFGHRCMKHSNNRIYLTGYSFVANTQNSNAAAMQTLFSTCVPDDGSLDGTYNGITIHELEDILQIEYAGQTTGNANVAISDDLFFDAINLNTKINVNSEIVTTNANTTNTNVFFDYVLIESGPERPYNLPYGDGTKGQALITDGAGNVYWKSVTISNEEWHYPVITLDWTGKDIIRINLNASTTITNTGAFDGQKCILELKQPPTGNSSVSFTGETRFSLSIPYFPTTLVGDKTDKIGFIYHGPDNKYDVVAISMGH